MEPQLEDFELRKEVSCRIVLMASHCLTAHISISTVVEIKEGEIGVTEQRELQHEATLHDRSWAESAVCLSNKTLNLVLLRQELNCALRRTQM